jgi:hypothetical protein
MRTGLFDRLVGSVAPGGSAAPAVAPGGGSGTQDRPTRAPPGRAWSGADPIGRLPGPAADKLARLRRAHEEAGILMRGYDEQRGHAAVEKEKASLYLDDCRKSRAAGRGGRSSSISTFISGDHMNPAGPIEHYEPPAPADDQQLEGAERRLEAATVALSEINRLSDEVSARRSRLPDTLTAWIAAVPGNAVLALHDNRKAAAKGRPADIVEAARSEVARLKMQIEQVRAAPLPSHVAATKMRQQIETLAAKGEPSILGLLESGYAVRFAESQIQATVLTPAGAGALSHSVVDCLALFCWVHGDALIAKLEAQISELADDAAALGDAEKAQREQQLRAEILEIERGEAEAIWAGAPVAWRPDIDPRACLGLSGDLPAPAN